MSATTTAIATGKSTLPAKPRPNASNAVVLS
jgi:hypothetical protein